jgi:chromodomain-helicase-DNA-binding protein 1
MQYLSKKVRILENQNLIMKLASYSLNPENFRISVPIKAAPPNWGKWGPKEDAMLLLGVHRHGFGNWQAIQQDKSLGLSKKIAETEDDPQLPKGPDLKKRVMMIFSALRNERVPGLKLYFVVYN